LNIIFLSFRGAGDAMIMTEMLNKYEGEFKNHNITIVTWSKNSFIFSELIITHKLLVVPFPNKNKYINFIISCFKIARLFQGKSYDLAINFSGDIKENSYLLFVKAAKKISPLWSRSNKQNNIITMPIFRNKYDIYISSELNNIYKIYEYIFSVVFNIKTINTPPFKNLTKVNSIGLFPFSAQACRDWPLEKWDLLAQKLINCGYDVYFISSEKDCSLISNLESLDLGALIYKDINNDVFQLNKIIDFSICLDSFSTHLSHFLRVPSLTLFGASHPELFLTTTTKSVSTDGDCNFYPCYNKPKCINSPQQYSCVTSISVDQVLSIFETRLKLL
jgi:heptosyltransferase III